MIHDAGGTAMFVRTDVTEPRSLEAMFAAAAAEYGGIDVVHNNAGLVCGEPLWPDITAETLKRVMDVNLGGVVVGHEPRDPVSAQARRRRDRQHRVDGRAVPDGRRPDLLRDEGRRHDVHPACAQHAEEGIRVNSVLPGLVDTPLLPKSGDGVRWADWAYASRDFMGLMGPEVVADAVLDLVHDDTAVAEERVVGTLPSVDAEGHRVE